MAKQPVTFQLQDIAASDGVLLPSLWHTSRSMRLVVWVHGAGSSSIIRNSTLMNSLAKSLGDKGIDFMAFNNRGAGYITKFRTRDGESVTGGVAYEKIADFNLDLSGVLKWAMRSGYEEVFLAGHSTGANKLVSSRVGLGQQSLVRGLILVAGGDDITLFGKLFGKKLHALQRRAISKINKGLGADLLPPHKSAVNHPLSWQSFLELTTNGSDYDMFPFGRHSTPDAFSDFKSITIPTLCVYGDKDFGPTIPAGRALTLLGKLNPMTHTMKITGADHNFTGKERQLAQVITKFVSDI